MTWTDLASFVADIVNILVVGGGLIYALFSLLRALWQRMVPVLAGKYRIVLTVMIAAVVLFTVMAQIMATMAEVGTHEELMRDMFREVFMIDRRLSAVENQGEASSTAIANLEAVVDEFGRDVRIYMWQQGQQAVQMIGVNEGICYLVYVTGEFNGQGEAIEISERDGFWVLQGHSSIQTSAGLLIARAQCWRFPTIQEETR